MNRIFGAVVVLLAATVALPGDAEARRRFFGGSVSQVPSTTSSRTAIVPVIGTSRAKASETGEPQRAPFPSATTAAQQPEPVSRLLRLSSNGNQKPWCRSEVVVGGFCIVN